MYKHGKFGNHPGAVKSTGSKVEPASTPQEKEHGPAQAPHGGGGGPEHVTKTHPGETQPHPVTGVHAFHAHHVGGGKYMSHTHHDGGDVETRHHPDHADMMNAHEEAFPPSEGDNPGDNSDMRDGGMNFAESLGGVGGAGHGGGY